MKKEEYISYKGIWLIAYPILISVLMEQLIGITDTAFLGRVGEIELGASAIAGVFYLAIFMAGFGFSIGAQILMARRNGEKEYLQIGQIFYQGTILLLILAAAIFVLTRYLSPYILRKILDSEEIRNAALDYLHWRIYGFFFSFIGVMFRAFYVGTKNTRTLTANSLVMVLSNVAFNYILIFGKWGFPAMGITGAAIGSSLAEMVSVIFFVIYTYKKIDLKKYGLNRFRGLQGKIIKMILNVSFWTMIQNFISLSTWFLFFVAVEHLGERPLAITNIIRSLSSIAFMVIIAFSSTCGSLVSNMIGEGQSGKVWEVINKTLRLTFIFTIPILLFFLLFPQTVIRIYTDNTELIQSAIPSLYVMCTAYLFLIPGNILFQTVSGTGNIRTAFLLEIITLVVYVAYVGYMIFYRQLDVKWAWTTEHVYGFTIFIVCYFYMKKGKWQNKRI